MNASSAAPSRRRGRPRQDELAARQAAMLDAAVTVLVEDGYDGFTVSAVADRAGTSKSTVYSWFGSRDGLLQSVISRSFEAHTAQFPPPLPLSTDESPREVLVAFTERLIPSMQSDVSLALARAALSNRQLRATLLATDAGERPLLTDFLAQLHRNGHLRIDDPVVAAKVLLGLLLQDDHLLILLGENPMDTKTVSQRAGFAVDMFLSLYARA